MIPMLAILLVGHFFVWRFSQRAADGEESMAEAAGLQTVGCFQTIWSNGATFTRAIDPQAGLISRLRDLPQLPDILVLDLGTNDLCPVGAAVSGVIDEAIASIELLRNSHLLPEHLVFMGVVQRTAASCHRGVPAHVFMMKKLKRRCLLEELQ